MSEPGLKTRTLAAQTSEGCEKPKIVLGGSLGEPHSEAARYERSQSRWPTKGPHGDTPEANVFILGRAKSHGEGGSRLRGPDGANEKAGGRYVVRKPCVLDPRRFKFDEKPSLLTESTLFFRHLSAQSFAMTAPTIAPTTRPIPRDVRAAVLGSRLTNRSMREAKSDHVSSAFCPISLPVFRTVSKAPCMSFSRCAASPSGHSVTHLIGGGFHFGSFRAVGCQRILIRAAVVPATGRPARRT